MSFFEARKLGFCIPEPITGLRLSGMMGLGGRWVNMGNTNFQVLLALYLDWIGSSTRSQMPAFDCGALSWGLSTQEFGKEMQTYPGWSTISICYNATPPILPAHHQAPVRRAFIVFCCKRKWTVSSESPKNSSLMQHIY